jgi:hypothetical protein
MKAEFMLLALLFDTEIENIQDVCKWIYLICSEILSIRKQTYEGKLQDFYSYLPENKFSYVAALF